MGSSSSSTKNTVENVSFNNVDYGGSGGGGAGALANNLNMNRSNLTVGDIYSTDHGAVENALGVAIGAVNANTALSDRFITAGGDLLQRSYDDVEDSRELIGSVFTRRSEERRVGKGCR